jgi:hypothetical protein
MSSATTSTGRVADPSQRKLNGKVKMVFDRKHATPERKTINQLVDHICHGNG